MHLVQSFNETKAQPLVGDEVLDLFGLEISDTTIERASAWIIRRAQHGTQTQISFLNADCVNIMHRDTNYRDALAASDRIFADGIGVKIAAWSQGRSLQDNVNGTDLFPVLCRHAAASGTGVYLFGAREGRAQASADAMQKANPDLLISGCHHGYIQDADHEARLIDDINASGAQIILVGLGAPAQELWISRNRHRLNAAVLIGVGGLFDYYSGSIVRAPQVVRKARMEWVWRLALEPRRLARRYILGNAEFLARVVFAGGNRGNSETIA